jgi:hypothetical protein
MKQRGVIRTGLAAAVSSVLLWAGAVGAEIHIAPWRSIFQGIERTVGRADASETRMHNVNALRIDVTARGEVFGGTREATEALLITADNQVSLPSLSDDARIDMGALRRCSHRLRLRPGEERGHDETYATARARSSAE